MGFKLGRVLGMASMPWTIPAGGPGKLSRTLGLTGGGGGVASPGPQSLDLERFYAPRREALRGEIMGPGGAFSEMRRRTTGENVAAGSFGSPVAQYGATRDVENAGRAYSSGLANLYGQQAGQEAQFADSAAQRQFELEQQNRADKSSLKRLLLGTAGGVVGGLVGGPPGAVAGAKIGEALTPEQERRSKLLETLSNYNGNSSNLT